MENSNIIKTNCTEPFKICHHREVELKEIKGPVGWQRISTYIKTRITKIIYMGKCKQDGETFIIYWDGFISLAKGKLR